VDIHCIHEICVTAGVLRVCQIKPVQETEFI
jgi:hypothetical protein